jgi:glutamine amidotransferase
MGLRMCRLLGVVAGETTPFGFALARAPRSLAALSPEHPDGWGLAVHARGRGWEVHRQPACAGADDRFGALAAGARGEILVSHIRKKTVGPTRLENTHPFTRDGWVFAHNGTIAESSVLTAETSRRRAAEVTGDTDSERYFAWLLSAIDAVGVAPSVRSLDEPARRARRAGIERALVDAVARLHRWPHLGPWNFLLSDGEVLYAHRRGRALFVLERGAAHERRRTGGARAVCASAPSTIGDRRRSTAIVASEATTDEPFREVPEGTLLAVRTGPRPRLEVLFAA